MASPDVPGHCLHPDLPADAQCRVSHRRPPLCRRPPPNGRRPTALDGECLTTTRGEAYLTPRLRCRTVSENYAAPLPVSRETARRDRPVVPLLFSRSTRRKRGRNAGRRPGCLPVRRLNRQLRWVTG